MKRMVMTVISTTMIFTALSGQGLWADEIKDLKAEIENLKLLIEQGLSQSTPPKAIMAFYTDKCPTGWLEADGTPGRPDLRGEFIRGLDRGRGVDKFYELDKDTLVATLTKERPLGSWQAPTLITTAIGPGDLQQGVIEGSTGDQASWDDFSSGMQTDWIDNSWYSNAFKGMIHVGSNAAYSQNSSDKPVPDNKYNDLPINGNSYFVSGGSRPRNVALLYCMKE